MNLHVKCSMLNWAKNEAMAEVEPVQYHRFYTYSYCMIWYITLHHKLPLPLA